MPRTAYIEHPLRNAARVLRWGVTDQRIVVACILHDTVEDHAFELAELFAGTPFEQEDIAHEVVLFHYSELFDRRTADIVRAMSNPLQTDANATEFERHTGYREHVIEEIADPDVAICKFADLTDNALSLHHTDEPEGTAGWRRTGKLARKYLPLIPIFVDRINRSDVRERMSEAGVSSVREALYSGIVRLNEMAKR